MTPKRFFNTVGPIDPERHYYVPPLSRIDLEQVDLLFEQRKYFVLHAPRQTGKTTVLRALQRRLNRAGRFRCVYASCQEGQASADDTAATIRCVLENLAEDAEDTLSDTFVWERLPELLERVGPTTVLRHVLKQWAAANSKPIVVLLDEIDALFGRPLVSVLTQLRTGYLNRSATYAFPHSIVLCGMRHVQDYEMARPTGDPGREGSPFNIVAKSLRLGDFTETEMRCLLAQHTEATGQPFSEDALLYIWDQTRGQPWLVNALAYEACFEQKHTTKRGRPIEVSALRDARENLIVRRESHIAQLGRRLEDPRVRRVVEQLLIGGSLRGTQRGDIEFARDLGIVAPSPPPAFANPIYGEVVPRELTSELQEEIMASAQSYVSGSGRLLMSRLLEDFQDFYRRNAEHWIERHSFREAGPHLVLHAFLHKVVNSGGRIEREAALGSGRADLLVLWPGGASEVGGADEQRILIECKLRRGNRDRLKREGAAQVRQYMDRAAAAEGHLLIFDRTKGLKWEDRVFREDLAGLPPVTAWGM
ncbi:MAG: AAA family ATPase [Bryobacterales bacterium]|nr:AAA family ATPase [Bryobacterales bacterium]